MHDIDMKPLTPAMLASRWGCSTTLVYDLLNAGTLVGFRLGTLWRIPARSVEDYECRTPSSSPSQSASDQSEARTAPASSPIGPTVAATAAHLARLTG